MCFSRAASTLASYVGYGNVAGFLFNKGIMSAPPPPANSSGAGAPTATPSGVPINPITGVAEKPAPPIEMSDEEKEREAEKLFVLFDLLTLVHLHQCVQDNSQASAQGCTSN